MVAKFLLPEGDAKTIELLTVYAQSSAKYLAGIDAVVRRSKYLAQKEGRVRVAGLDVKRAIKESVIPSDSALAQAMEAPSRSNRKGRNTAQEMPVQPAFRGDARAVQEHPQNNFADRKSALTTEANRIPERGNLQEV